MNFFASVMRNFHAYADFKTRSPRPDFWFWILLIALLVTLLTVLQAAVNALTPDFMIVATIIWICWLVLVIASVGVIIPTFAVTARRLRDTNVSGWLCLLLLIPCVGPVAIAVLAARAGTAGDNKFGGPCRQ